MAQWSMEGLSHGLSRRYLLWFFLLEDLVESLLLLAVDSMTSDMVMVYLVCSVEVYRESRCRTSGGDGNFPPI